LGCLKNFKPQGFAIVPRALQNGDVERLRAELSQTTVARSRAGIRHAMRIPAVARLAEDWRLLTVAKDALGSDAVPFRATMFDKSSSANWLVVWHQDTALPLERRVDKLGWGPWSMKDGVNYAHAPAEALSQIVALRVHLDDSTSDNGPLRVLPGTHSSGVLTDDVIHNLSMKIAGVECLTAQGGVVVMRPLVVHASSKSRNDKPRRVIHIEYATSLCVADGVKLAIT
jgi:ectoine hydroxylase-related dioxygenase (phytanoyl-CoA dioxygenase family)